MWLLLLFWPGDRLNPKPWLVTCSLLQLLGRAAYVPPPEALYPNPKPKKVWTAYGFMFMFIIINSTNSIETIAIIIFTIIIIIIIISIIIISTTTFVTIVVFMVSIISPTSGTGAPRSGRSPCGAGPLVAERGPVFWGLGFQGFSGVGILGFGDFRV